MLYYLVALELAEVGLESEGDLGEALSPLAGIRIQGQRVKHGYWRLLRRESLLLHSHLHLLVENGLVLVIFVVRTAAALAAVDAAVLIVSQRGVLSLLLSSEPQTVVGRHRLKRHGFLGSHFERAEVQVLLLVLFGEMIGYLLDPEVCNDASLLLNGPRCRHDMRSVLLDDL